jgi:hypothetical protein
MMNRQSNLLLKVALAIVASVLTVCGPWGRANAQPYQLTVQSGVTPAPQNAGGQVVGVVGGATLYYWVAANFPNGQGPATGPVTVTRTVGVPNLTLQNYVSITWAAVPGATSYDVWRNASPTNPVLGGSCASCGIVANTPLTTANDQGAGFAYTAPAQIQAGQAVLTIDNQSSSTGPFMNMAFFNNQYRLGLFRGAFTARDCVEIDANGFLTSAGAACGTGGGGGSGVTFLNNNTPVGTRSIVNLLSGFGMTLAASDDPPNLRVNITATANSAVLLDRDTGTSGVDNTCIPASGSGTAFTCNPLGNALSTYTNGMEVRFRPDVSCTGSPTLNISTRGVRNLYAADGVTPATCTAGLSYPIIYNDALAAGIGGWTFPATGGSGGSTFTRGPYATPPACTVSGDAGKQYWTSDAALIGYCDGVAGWLWKYKAVDVIPRALSYFPTAYNQAANYSEVDLVAAFRLKVDNAGTPQTRGRLRTIPTPPYTVYACMEPGNLTRINTVAGIILTNGTTTAALNRMVGQQSMNSFGNNVAHGHSALNLNAANGGALNNLAVNYKAGGGEQVCYAFTDDNAGTRRYAFANDGKNFNLVFSESSAAGFTPTHWGVAGYNGSDETGVILTVRSAGELNNAITILP